MKQASPRWLVAGAAVAASLLVVSTARAASSCLPAPRPSSCSPSLVAPAGGPARPALFEVRWSTSAPPVSALSPAMMRVVRGGPSRRRPAQQIDEEIGRAERAIAASAEGSIARRAGLSTLAQLWLEREARAEDEREPLHERDAPRASARPDALAAAARAARALVDASSQGARAHALAQLALSLELSGDRDAAREQWARLIAESPESPSAAAAYAAFGDAFAHAAAGDDAGQLELSRISFARAGRVEGASAVVRSYAHMRLSDVLRRGGDPSQLGAAATALEQAIAASREAPVGAEQAELFASSVELLIDTLARSPGDANAFDRLRALAPPGDDDEVLRLAEKLGDALLAAGRDARAAELFDELARRDVATRSLSHRARSLRASLSSSADAPALAPAARELLDELRQQRRSMPEEHARAAARATFEAALAIASRTHRDARSPEALTTAAGLYERVLAEASQADLEALAPGSRQRPSRAIVASALGHARLSLGDHDGCAQAYDEAAALSPSAEPIVGAALCHLSARGTSEARARASAEAAPSQKAKTAGADVLSATPAQTRALDAFDRALCTLVHSPDEPRATALLPELRFARASLLLDTGRAPEAALALRSIAESTPEHRRALDAASLYLDAIAAHTQAEGEAPEGCDAEVTDAVPRLVRAVCDPSLARDERRCASLVSKKHAVRRGIADRLVASADAAGDAASDRLERAGKLFYEIARECALEPSLAQRPPTCERPEELIASAAEAYRAGHFTMKSIRARLLLLNPAHGLDKTPRAAEALFLIGRSYEAISVHDEAATFYERFARAHPAQPNAPQALLDAFSLRLSLGQDDEAESDARLFVKSYGERRAVEAAGLHLSTARRLLARDEHERARAVARSALRLLAPRPPATMHAEAHALIARASRALGDDHDARSSYARARDIAHDLRRAGAQPVDGDPRDDKALARALAQTLAEASLFFADQAARPARRPSPPPFSGPPTDEGASAYVTRQLTPWLSRQRELHEARERAYADIVSLEAEGASSFAVTAQSRLLDLREAFVDLLDRAPSQLTRDPALASSLRRALAPLAAPARRAAHDAAERCLAAATRTATVGDDPARCARHLARRGVAGIALDDLRPSPGLSTQGAPRPQLAR